MSTGLEHIYVEKTEHVIRYKIGDVIEVAPEREEWRPVLHPYEKAVISSIYDIVTMAMDETIRVETWVVFNMTHSKIDSARGREFEDRIENVRVVEVKDD